MRHELVSAIEKALGWTGPDEIGKSFARGNIGDLELLERILTPEHLLDVVMRRSLNRPQFRLFQNGEELHPAKYITDTVSPRGQAIPMVDMNRLGGFLREGATLILDQLNTFDPTMEVACQALQWWARERVQVNVYLTTNEASGFPLHWDDHDVVIVQLAGEKEWEVRGTSRPAPMYRDADPNTAPSEEGVWSGVMKPGDVMHIPRGFWHQATRNGSGSGFSLHATFGITKRTGASYVAWGGDWVRTKEIFRHDLDRNPGADTSELLEELGEFFQENPPAKYLAAYEQQPFPTRNVPFVDIFGPLKAVVCNTHFRPRIEVEGSVVSVTAAGRNLLFAGRALPAVRLLLDGGPVGLDAVKEAVGFDVTEIAETLVKEGLCAPLTKELSLGYTGLVTSPLS
ncbi:cupin [Streptomyces albus subsp. chlorinus]|uniref:JmjC domain-containing protein n=1 Tax=Streptomyces albus TaxID=1888 RepID=UPI00156DAE14|nr:cupin domain-containing protein [Streptomyces albus]NSC25729.1 cupin [Streptomyces albus subsp. chlorinus]